MKLHASVILVFAVMTSLMAEDAPSGFKYQELEPLGGKILMPESWHYKGGMTSNGFMFILSKEKREDGSYDTGFRIQGFVGVRQKSGISAHQASLSNRDKFKKEAKEILKECEEEHIAPFRKTCLEVIQPNPGNPKDDFHIIYSFFWNEEWDMMVVSIFGAPQSQWKEAEKVYEQMQGFQLMDPEKIK